MSAKTKVLSRMGALAKGALLVHLRPVLAQDATIDLNPLLFDLTSKNFKAKKPTITTGIGAALKGKLKAGVAMDASIAEVTNLLDHLEEIEEAEGMDTDPATGAMKAMPQPATMDASEFLKGKLSAEDMATYDAMCAAGKAQDEADEDEEKKKKAAADAEKDEEKDDKVDKKAMDAAIQSAVTAANKTQKDIRDAERHVRAWVGDLAMAHDSAEGVFRSALDVLGIKHEGVHHSALKTILDMQPKPGAKTRVSESEIAQDAAPSADYLTRFPEAARFNSAH